MTKSKKLQLAEIEARRALDAAIDDETEGAAERLAEARNKLRETQDRLAAALEMEDAPVEDMEPEAREFAELEARATVAGFVGAALEDSELEGAEKEMVDALEIRQSGGGVQMPTRMLARADEETRADAVTSLSVDTEARPRGWLTRLFNGTIAGHLGITSESVPTGVASYPIIGSGTSAATVAKGTQKDAAAMTVTVEELKPQRITGRYVFNREDLARLPSLEAQIAVDLRHVMADQMESEIVNGATEGNTTLISGLSSLTANPDEALAAATGGKGFADLLLAGIDGKYAHSPADIRVAVTPGFSKYLQTLVFDSTDNAPRVYAAQALASIYGINVRASAHLGDIDGAAGESYAYASLAGGLRGAAALPVWDSVTLIRDPYSNAGKGEIVLTAAGLWNFQIMRAANFAKHRVALS